MVCPSNILDKGLKGFPTLGDPPFPTECKDKALKELVDVGIPRGCTEFTTKEIEVFEPGSEMVKFGRIGIYTPHVVAQSKTVWKEVHKVKAYAFKWNFYRAWYYWVCFANPNWGDAVIPEEIARELNGSFGKEIRVEGFAGGQDVHGPVTSYHVDTPRGLAVLVSMLKHRNKVTDKARMERKERV